MVKTKTQNRILQILSDAAQREDTCAHQSNEEGYPSAANSHAERADEIRSLADQLKTSMLISDAALTACHSAMLGNVHPKHPAWGVLFSAQDNG